jgi:hypothetical protein
MRLVNVVLEDMDDEPFVHDLKQAMEEVVDHADVEYYVFVT